MCCVFCFVGEVLHQTEEQVVYGIEHNSTLLECFPRNLQAKVIWFVQRSHEARREEVFFFFFFAFQTRLLSFHFILDCTHHHVNVAAITMSLNHKKQHFEAFCSIYCISLKEEYNLAKQTFHELPPRGEL